MFACSFNQKNPCSYPLYRGGVPKMVVHYPTTLGFPNLKMIILGWWNGGIPPPYTPSLCQVFCFIAQLPPFFSIPPTKPRLSRSTTPQMWVKPSNSSWWKYQSSQVVSWSSKLIKMLIWATKEMFETNYIHHFLFVIRSSFLILAISSSLPFQMCLSLLRGAPAQVNVTTAPWSPQSAHIFCCDNCSLQRHVWSFNRARSTVENKNVRFKMAN